MRAHCIAYHKNFIEVNEKWLQDRYSYMRKIKADITKLEKQIEFRKIQIQCAERNGKTEFNEDQYLKNRREKYL